VWSRSRGRKRFQLTELRSILHYRVQCTTKCSAPQCTALHCTDQVSKLGLAINSLVFGGFQPVDVLADIKQFQDKKRR
jgi:hypothetical protein